MSPSGHRYVCANVVNVVYDKYIHVRVKFDQRPANNTIDK